MFTIELLIINCFLKPDSSPTFPHFRNQYYIKYVIPFGNLGIIFDSKSFLAPYNTPVSPIVSSSKYTLDHSFFHFHHHLVCHLALSQEL